ncbi:ABC transporter permease [Calditerrivibrio nitroreducens]|uniref:Inner-membrane translocator n=1 Tax=Calditerrivibrio nitroreducens (strain DSM 19672 / NBRC 101217 / Yu37-1) TaxID=768670 RepID=E4TEW6_CALNY|nr:ABC transporter permease [Calditerrivibrio nitroreducens]ADR18372.1 inner-membrane translocator [Calditerrivibrio nitroreducens DSM 19672]
MSFYAFLGAIEQGLVYGIMALGVYITFRILDFPDLSVDGTFPLGASVVAVLIVHDINPYLSTIIAFLAGVVAGMITGILNTKLKILNLLSGILVMIALYSVNIRIMGQPNTSLLGYDTIFTPIEAFFDAERYMISPVVFLVVIIFLVIAMTWFFHTDIGLGMRGTGDNPKMVKAQGINNNFMVLLGLAFSNGLVALSGALVAQSQGSADVNMGIGTIVAGLASVILGEAFLEARTVFRGVLAVVLGSVVYRFAIAVALSFRVGSFQLNPSDLNLITAIIVTSALVSPGIKKVFKSRL